MEEILKFAGIYSGITIAITTLIGFLGKKIIDQILKRDLEKFKTELATENQKAKIKFDKEIESYRAELNLLNTKQSLLHTNRTEIINELYQKLVDLHHSMLDMTALMREVTGKDNETLKKEEFERISNTSNIGNEFFKFYERHKIYFTEETCTLIEEIQSGFKESHTDYSFRHLWGLPPTEMTYEMAKNANTKVKDEIPKLMNKLENEFRKSIGVIK